MAEEKAKPVTDQHTAKPGDGKEDELSDKNELSDKDLEQVSGGVSWSGSTGGDETRKVYKVLKPL